MLLFSLKDLSFLVFLINLFVPSSVALWWQTLGILPSSLSCYLLLMFLLYFVLFSLWKGAVFKIEDFVLISFSFSGSGIPSPCFVSIFTFLLNCQFGKTCSSKYTLLSFIVKFHSKFTLIRTGVNWLVDPSKFQYCISHVHLR